MTPPPMTTTRARCGTSCSDIGPAYSEGDRGPLLPDLATIPPMNTTTPAGPLPPLYEAWIDQLLGSAIPPETVATCHDCAMLPRAGEEVVPGEDRFSPRVKCCTFQPSLPNFLVGRILSDEDPAMAAGRATV